MTPRGGRALRTGALLVVGYVAVVAVTLRATGHHVRPLFEGIGPAAPYDWVDPPTEFAAGNTKPSPASVDIPLAATGSPPAGPATTDGQIVLAMPAGALPVHGADTKAVATITPLAPKTLGPVPAGLRADGNVYQVGFTYQPSATAVDALASPGNVILVVPEPATAILYSADGQSWTKLDTQQVGGAATTTVGAQLARAGYYLGAASGAASTGGASGGSDTGSIVLVAIATAALALAIGFGPPLVRRRRQGRP